MVRKNADYLVVSDVDGTLLQAGYGVPRENLDAIERFVFLGGRFTLCSGRNSESVGKLTEWVKLSAPAILCNGAYVFDYKTREVVFSAPLAPSVREVTADILAMFPHLGVEITAEPNVYVARMSRYVQEYTASHHIRYTLCDVADIPSGWHKVVFTDDGETILKLEEYVTRQSKNGGAFAEFDFVRTSTNMIEILAKGINKATGLHVLCDHLGIQRRNTIAIGDYYNDVELLRAAGIKVSVANAPADIRAMTDITVAACLKGGVAQVLDGFDTIVGDFEQLSWEV
ncbi:MAG: Cof-type HAD-IIB family hydrolase [Oscillospiraceae bacterium]|nr:Cof-type HAD-IIB family hydrolase [Oscillospiraceae bacterium]